MQGSGVADPIPWKKRSLTNYSSRLGGDQENVVQMSTRGTGPTSHEKRGFSHFSGLEHRFRRLRAVRNSSPTLCSRPAPAQIGGYAKRVCYGETCRALHGSLAGSSQPPIRNLHARGGGWLHAKGCAKHLLKPR